MSSTPFRPLQLTWVVVMVLLIELAMFWKARVKERAARRLAELVPGVEGTHASIVSELLLAARVNT